MDCDQVGELLAPYALGALQSSEKKSVETHISFCLNCSVLLTEYNETTALLAQAVPQHTPSEEVKVGLFAKVDALSIDEDSAELSEVGHVAATLTRSNIWWLFNEYAAAAMVAAIVVGVLSVSIWFNYRLNDLADENDRLAERLTQQASNLSNSIELVARRSDQGIDRLNRQSSWLVEVVQEQRSLTYLTASPGVNVYPLQAMQETSKARGMIMVSPSAKYGILAVLQLEQLPPDRVYQVWLIRDGQREDGGYFLVDSTGYGQISISTQRPLYEYQAIGITIEPDGGSIVPTGKKILDGDM